VKEAGNFRYKINEDFSLNAWWKTDEEGKEPWLFQPYHPTTGEIWTNAEEPEQWFLDMWCKEDTVE
jgi:hypothetical protein